MKDLTITYHKILQLMAIGYNNRAISRQLKIPERTVYRHSESKEFLELKDKMFNELISDNYNQLKIKHIALLNKIIDELSIAIDDKKLKDRVNIMLRIYSGSVYLKEV